MVKEVQVVPHDTQEHGCHLESESLKTIDVKGKQRLSITELRSVIIKVNKCISHSLVNRSSGFLGMRIVFYMGLQVFMYNTIYFY